MAINGTQSSDFKDMRVNGLDINFMLKTEPNKDESMLKDIKNLTKSSHGHVSISDVELGEVNEEGKGRTVATSFVQTKEP